MFKFKPTKKTYSDPTAATFKPGIPFGRKYSAGDICLLHDGFKSSKIFLNSRVLRAAILNSKEFLEEVLEISIKDKRESVEEPKKEMEVVEADLAKGNVPESGKDLILDSEDLIVGNTDEVIIDGVEEIPKDAVVVDEVVIDAPAEVADIIVEAVTEKKTKRATKK